MEILIEAYQEKQAHIDTIEHCQSFQVDFTAKNDSRYRQSVKIVCITIASIYRAWKHNPGMLIMVEQSLRCSDITYSD